jgi:hypothetical protein
MSRIRNEHTSARSLPRTCGMVPACDVSSPVSDALWFTKSSAFFFGFPYYYASPKEDGSALHGES